MEKTNTITENNVTLYQEFEDFMSGLFEIVEDLDVMESDENSYKSSIRHNFSLNYSDEQINLNANEKD
jgi:hypothetical protein